MAVVKCAASDGAARGGLEKDETLYLCLRAVRKLWVAVPACNNRAAAAAAVDGNTEPPPVSVQPCAEAAFDLACRVVEREWVGNCRLGGEGSQSGSSKGGGEDGDVRENTYRMFCAGRIAGVSESAIVYSAGIK